MQDFDKALAAFVAGAQQLVNDHLKRNKFPWAESLTVQPGRRYVRVVIGRKDGTHPSVWCFVDSTNGDVLKAAGWRAPAKHARGNIYNEDRGVKGCNHYGPNYLK